jgi:hypothetical protein
MFPNVPFSGKGWLFFHGFYAQGTFNGIYVAAEMSPLPSY